MHEDEVTFLTAKAEGRIPATTGWNEWRLATGRHPFCATTEITTMPKTPPRPDPERQRPQPPRPTHPIATPDPERPTPEREDEDDEEPVDDERAPR